MKALDVGEVCMVTLTRDINREDRYARSDPIRSKGWSPRLSLLEIELCYGKSLFGRIPNFRTIEATDFRKEESE